MKRPRLFLIDSYGFIFRAYHARARSGAPPMRTAAGLQTEAVYIFHNMLRKLIATYKPEYIAAVWESGRSFREDTLYAEYKANRVETPPDLIEQIPQIRRLVEAMRIPILEYPGFEADDVIGTVARLGSDSADVVIVSSDKDMLQLVGDHVHMFNPAKEEIWYDAAETEKFMGVKPGQVADLLALKGDAVDNIPGAPGIGDKGAKDLILRFGSVEAALERAAEVERKMYRESLMNHRDRILLSKKLATIDTSVPIEWTLAGCAFRGPDPAALKPVYRDLEFFSFLKELGPPEETHSRDYSALGSRQEVEALGEGEGPFAVALRSEAEGGLGLTTVGVSRGIGGGRAFPVEHLDALKPVLEDSGRAKTAHDVKSLLLELARRGVEGRGFAHDSMLYAFLLLADPAACSLESLSERFLDRKLGAGPEEHADAALTLSEKLRAEVELQGLGQVYRAVDLPSAAVLASMERVGIRVDPAQLAVLSERMDLEVQRLTAEIHQLAGRPFNINSPQQVGKVLFEDLEIPPPFKYGKGKQLSTAADVLEGLAPDYPIAGKVLEYRGLAKLKGTYVDALPLLIEPGTGRLHTTFNQTGAATGRLSSSNPNLQNIPIRTELGREIRAAFVPRGGWRMVVADYSQIELRLLAHMSLDPVLVEAFRNGEDIHTRTAAEVFRVHPQMVSGEMRRAAKAVNFGIVYGQTPFGLAASIDISRKEAETYIRAYFKLYAGVKVWIDKTVEEVRASGFAITLFGRKRPIPDMTSRNSNARGFAERTAVNTPLQGTAADLIKLAMIQIDGELAARGMRAKMLLQVHDELVFEAPEDEVEAVKELAKRQMEGVYRLEVPLVVDVGAGPNWRDAK